MKGIFIRIGTTSALLCISLLANGANAEKSQTVRAKKIQDTFCIVAIRADFDGAADGTLRLDKPFPSGACSGVNEVLVNSNQIQLAVENPQNRFRISCSSHEIGRGKNTFRADAIEVLLQQAATCDSKVRGTKK